LASLTLFIAVSKPKEMQTVKHVAISILNRKAQFMNETNKTSGGKNTLDKRNMDL